MEKMSCNIAETAKMLGVCKGTVRALIDEGKLRAIRPSERRILVPLDAIKAYLNADLS